jgi:hypothetical protein
VLQLRRRVHVFALTRCARWLVVSDTRACRLLGWTDTPSRWKTRRGVGFWRGNKGRSCSSTQKSLCICGSDFAGMSCSLVDILWVALTCSCDLHYELANACNLFHVNCPFGACWISGFVDFYYCSRLSVFVTTRLLGCGEVALEDWCCLIFRERHHTIRKEFKKPD